MVGIQGLLARTLDIVLVIACALLASEIRVEEISPSALGAVFVVLSVAVTIVVFPWFGVYESWRGRSGFALVSRVTLAWLAVQVCDVILMFALQKEHQISRMWFFSWSVLTVIAMISMRALTYAMLGYAREAGINLRGVAVVGCGEHGQQVLRQIEASPTSGFRAVSTFNVHPGETGGDAWGGLPAFSDFVQFAKHLRTVGVRELWLALPLSEEAMIQRCIQEFRKDIINIRFIPDVRGLSMFNSGVSEVIGAPAINLVTSPLSPSALMQKEVFDRVFGAFALLALAPLMLGIAMVVKLSSPGPVFFTQMRKGIDGRVFKIYKFRTMRVHRETPGVVSQATRHDSRITRVGRFLRRTSLDELPQFLNVLRGEMSVVGPRPHALEHDDLYEVIVEGYVDRYRVKPGITGWAQVNGFRGETDRVEKMQSRIEHDLYYLRNWSFALDMRIIAATFVKGFVNSNAY